MQVLLAHCPEHALELRHAPPSHAWLAACRRCRGPEILFAFFEGLSEETPADSAALGHLLRKFQSQGSQVITRGGRVLVVEDGPRLSLEETPFIYLDRRRYDDDQTVKIRRDCAKHVIVEHCRAVDSCESGLRRIIESVWLPKATSVGAATFYRCERLVHVSLPAIDSVGDRAFSSCTSMRSIHLGARDVGDQAFVGCSKLQAASLPFARRASSGLFAHCRSLTSVSMPVATTLETDAFRVCSSLTAVAFPSVRQVGAWAFDGCRKLETVSLPCLDVVDDRAFRDCPRLTRDRIVAPNVVKDRLILHQN